MQQNLAMFTLAMSLPSYSRAFRCLLEHTLQTMHTMQERSNT